MNKEGLKKHIKTLLTEQGLEAFGYCSADPFSDLADLYERRQMEGTACSFEKRDSIEALVSPEKLLKGAASFLVVLVPHRPYEAQRSPLKGRFASGTVSWDYHLDINDKLLPVSQWLSAEGINNRILCDTSPLSDRAIANRAGLGLIRRNGMFYHITYGSFVHIGSILMDKDLHEKDVKPIRDPCGHCRRCVAACPGNAILGDGTIDSNRCLSWLTQKKELTDAESLAIGDRLYGCDDCQQVCPANSHAGSNPDLPLILPESIPLVDLLNISNRTFKETYQQTSTGWRGKRTLQRNALAALGNSGAPEAVPLVRPFTEDQRPIISREAKRSLHKLRETT